ncbi:MAG TPA: hypothetical protein VF662_13550, partial [Allosphingosinicella sp.]
MKTLLKIFAVAAALGLTPAAALSQATQPAAAQPAAAAQQPVMKGAPPSDAISAASQARGGAQPEEVSDPSLANAT